MSLRFEPLCLVPLVFAACGGDVFLRVHVDAIPGGAITLVVGSVLSGHPATPESFALKGLTEESFALALPRDRLGWLSLGISAIDADACDLSWQAPALDVIGAADVIDLYVELAEVGTSICDARRTPGMMYVA